jgi:hypothetical protein
MMNFVNILFASAYLYENVKVGLHHDCNNITVQLLEGVVAVIVAYIVEIGYKDDQQKYYVT